jgi:cholesterol transport system auxiliary component
VNLKRIVATSSVVLLAACSIGRPIPTPTTYDIELTSQFDGSAKPARSERLRVGRVRIAAPYDQTLLVYRLSPVHYAIDPYNAFAADPGLMLGTRLAQWLGNAGRFTAVDDPGAIAPARWMLDVTVTELYGDFEPGEDRPAAVVSVHLVLIDQQRPRAEVVLERSLSRRVTLPNSSPEALVRGYGTALTGLLSDFDSDLERVP